MFYTKLKSDGKQYHGHDRSDYEPGFGKVPLWQRRAIKRAYEADEMTVRAIAYHFDVQERTVTRIAREYGLPPKIHYLAVSTENFDKAMELWKTTAPMSEVARLLGTPAIASCVKTKLEVEMRRRGIPGKLPRKLRSDSKDFGGPRKPLFTEKKMRELAEKRKAGMSWKAIGKDENVPDYVVSRAFNMSKANHPEWFV